MDIRADTDREVSESTLRELAGQLSGRFPKSVDQRQVGAAFKFVDGKLDASQTDSAGLVGIRIESSGNGTVVQLKRQGLVFSQLAPYRSGDTLIGEALDLWTHYAAAIGATGVSRIGLRYINELRLPWVAGDEISRFLLGLAELPLGAPRSTVSAHSRVVAQEQMGGRGPYVIVNQKLDGVQDGDALVAVSVIDIDVVSRVNLSTAPEGIKTALEASRVLKNRVFFSLLTEEALEGYL